MLGRAWPMVALLGCFLCIYENEHTRVSVYAVHSHYEVHSGPFIPAGVWPFNSQQNPHYCERDIVQCTYGTILGEDVIPSASFQHNPLTPYIAV